LVDGRLAGFSAYVVGAGTLNVVHTEVDDAFEGHGVGSALVRQMLDQLRERTDVTVATSCPFVRAWLRRHPDYQELTRR
jgi:predicted GNAT family acetyltransferase